MMPDVLKILVPTILTFLVGILITPTLSKYMYRWKLWKKTARENNPVEISKIYKGLHNKEEEKRTPRVGGVVIWMSVIITVLLLCLVAIIVPSEITEKLNFFSRNQTLIIVVSFFFGSILGLVDDLMQTGTIKMGPEHGFTGKVFALIVFFVASFLAFWFYVKLGMDFVHIPFVGEVTIGLWFIPFFVLAMMGVFSSGVIDGIDGLSGGVFAVVFLGFAIVGYMSNQIDIATLSSVIGAGILAFLWFNVPPARFYMGETGMLGLTISLTLIAFLTERPLLLLVIGFPLVATSLSSTIQIAAKRWWGRKVFLVAPLHHHFQALGWKSEKVVMRYWIITSICAALGIALFLIS